MYSECQSTLKNGRRRRQRRRSWLHIFGLKPIHLLLFLSTTFIVALVTFIVTFYHNSDYFFDFFYFITSKHDHISVRRSLDDLIKNYEPREFNGKRISLTYDQAITYQDFNYLQIDSLTYDRRTYSSTKQLLFRFPLKVPISATLLIFHSCNHTAEDWFQTVERQRIIGAAVDLGFACLVFQATDQSSHCWSNDVDIYANKDVEMVSKVLQKFYKEFPKLSNELYDRM